MKRISSIKTPAISDDAPRVTQADFDHAEYRVAGTKVTKSQWQAAVPARTAKQRVSIMLDAPIIAYFKTAAGERGYQTLINETLRRVMDGEQVVGDVRLAIREELAKYKVRWLGKPATSALATADT